jgi:hypothetical protein
MKGKIKEGMPISQLVYTKCPEIAFICELLIAYFLALFQDLMEAIPELNF